MVMDIPISSLYFSKIHSFSRPKPLPVLHIQLSISTNNHDAAKQRWGFFPATHVWS